MPHPALGRIPRQDWPGTLQEIGGTGLAGVLGVEVTEMRDGHLSAVMDLNDRHMLHAGGLIHAGTLVSFADTCAGWGCITSLPEHAAGFTTVELKTNFLATVRSSDGLSCSATMLHEGRTTQIWDAIVRRSSDDRVLCAYRCTQLLLAESRD